MKNTLKNNIISSAILVVSAVAIIFASKKASDEGFYRLKYEGVGQYGVGYTIYDVALISNKSNKSTISGYIFQLTQAEDDVPIKMYLRNVDTDKYTWVKLQQQDRPDVESFYADGTDYTACGFTGEISNRKLKKATYQICLCYNYDHSYLALNKYIVNGQLVDAVSYTKADGQRDWLMTTEIEEPNFTNTALADITASARLCSVLLNTGSYIYQAADKLYFIAGENVNYDAEGNFTLNWSYMTYQTDKLPAENVNGNYGYMSGAITIEETEDKSLASDGYRVMVYDLPDCGISQFSMSCYASDGTSDWDTFRIDMY